MKPTPIYLRMPRCGSTSIEAYCNKYKIKCYGGVLMGFWGGGVKTADYLWECVSNRVGKEVYEASYTFSSVRNPYSRAVSMFTHNSWSSIKTFPQFCRALKKEEYPSLKAKWHTSSLTDHLVKKDVLQVDFVIKLEKFQSDFDVMCRDANLPPYTLPHENRSNHKPYTDYYDDETREIICEKYAKDIEYFGYSF